MQPSPAELAKLYRLRIQSVGHVTNFCGFLLFRASFMTKTVPCGNELHKFLIWDTAGQERVSITLQYVFVIPVSFNVLCLNAYFSKPFIFRRLCRYKPTESLQGSAKQMVNSHQLYRFQFHRWGKYTGRLTMPLT